MGLCIGNWAQYQFVGVTIIHVGTLDAGTVFTVFN